jgi:hypothetical protein
MEDLVKVTARKRPFLSDFVTCNVLPGTTIAAAVLSLYPNRKIRALAVAFLDGEPVPVEQWGETKLTSGQLLNVSLVPQDELGLGSDTLRVAITALFAIGGNLIDAAVKGPWGWIASTVGLLGGWLVSLLIPASETTLDQTGYSLSGGRNTATLYGPIPKIYGRMRVVPPLASMPYTETLGEDQYIRIVVVLGYGPLTVRRLSIGDVEIMTGGRSVHDRSAYAGVKVEIREGVPNERPMTLMPQNVNEQSVEQKLTYGMEPVTRTTSADTDEIAVELAFPDGLCNKPNDNIKGWSVYIRIRYRPHDSGDDGWIEVDEAAAAQLSDLAAMTRTPSNVVSWLNTLTAGLTDAAASILGLDPGDWTATEETRHRLLEWIDNAAHAIANAKNPSGDGNLFTAIEDCANAIAAIAPLVGGVTIVPLAFAGPAQAITDVLCLVLDGVQILVNVSDAVSDGYGGALSTHPMLERWWIQLRGLQEYFPEITVDEARITGATVKPMRKGYRWQVTRGRYDVWIQKTQPDVDPEEHPDVVEEMHWSLLRSIHSTPPIELASLPPLAMVALRVKATDQFTGSLDQINAEVTARLPVAHPDGDGGYTWTVEETRNPAWAWLDALCGPNRPGLTVIPRCHVPRPVGLDRVESLDDVAEWAAACDEEQFRVGEGDIRTGRTFDVEFKSQMTQDAMLKAIAAAGQASHGRPGGKFGIVRDVLLTVPDQHFTPANSWGFGCTVRHAKLPNALRVNYADAENNYQTTERIVYDDGYGPAADSGLGILAAETYETLDIVGCTDPRQAWCDARNYLAQTKLRPRRFQLSSMADWLTCRRGGLVRVTHDVPMWGLAWGRIVSIAPVMTEDDPPVPVVPAATLLTFDNAIPMQAGHTYNLVVVYSDGWTPEVAIELDGVLVDGEYSVVTFQGEFELSPATDVSAGGVAAAEGDMWMAGEEGHVTQDLKVVDIQCGKDMTATLTLVDAAPDVHRDPNDPIPDFLPGTFVPPVLETPRPAPPEIATYSPADGRAGQLMIFADERACTLNPDGSLTPSIIVHLVKPSFPAGVTIPDALEVQHQRVADAGHEYEPTLTYWVAQAPLPVDSPKVQVVGIAEAHTYNVRMRYTCRNGLCSAWAEATVYLSGKTNPPPDVPSVYLDNGATLRWSYPDWLRPVDFRGFVVRQYPALLPADEWAAALPVGDGYITNTTLNVGMFGPGPRTFFVKALDTSGNESANAAIVQTDIAGVTPQNVVYSYSLAAADWFGEPRGCEVDDGKLVASADPMGSDLPMYPVPMSDPQYPPNEEDAFYQQGWNNGTFTFRFAAPAGTDGYPITVSIDSTNAVYELWYGPNAFDTNKIWPGVGIADESEWLWFNLQIKAAGATAARPTFSDIVIMVDVPDITEHFEDLAITVAADGVRLPIARAYHEILGVGGLTMQQDAHGAVVLKVVDKGYPTATAPTDGPLVKAYNAAGTAVQVDAFDATVWGY